MSPTPYGPKVENTISPRSLPYAFFAIAITVLMFYIVWVAKSVLVPLVTAIFLSFLIMSVKRAIDRIPVIGRYIPGTIGFILSFLIIAVTLLALAVVVRENIEGVLAKAPEYQERFREVAQNIIVLAQGMPIIPPDIVEALAGIVEGVGSGILPDTGSTSGAASATEDLRKQAFLLVQGAVGSVTSAAGGLLGSLVTTFLYTAFLLVERGRFLSKIALIVGKEKGETFIHDIADDISHLIRTYISMKTLINLFVASVSYGIMAFRQTDFAGFWALIIFAFGYIPIVGAILAVSMPTILTLVQPEHGGLINALITMALLTGAEQSVSSVVEPRLMGRSLNLSPLVILISLATWGTLWGFPGMLLCVPMTVTLLIILSQFKTTRPVAILLSDNGEISPLKDGHTDVEES
ncbi:MAG: AI-2E family transporter [Pseudomonadota bacterium]